MSSGWGGWELPHHAHIAIYIIAPLSWLLYAITPLGRLSAFRSDASLDEETGGDTQNIAYDDVARIKGQAHLPSPSHIFPRLRTPPLAFPRLPSPSHAFPRLLSRPHSYEMEPFICPQLTESVYRSAKLSRLEVQTSSEQQAKRAAVTSASQPRRPIPTTPLVVSGSHGYIQGYLPPSAAEDDAHSYSNSSAAVAPEAALDAAPEAAPPPPPPCASAPDAPSWESYAPDTAPTE